MNKIKEEIADNADMSSAGNNASVAAAAAAVPVSAGGDNSDKESAMDETGSVTTNTSRSKSPTAKRKTKKKSRAKPQLFQYDCHAKEMHGGSLFGVVFNQHLGRDGPIIFSTVGSNRVTVYECPREGGLKFINCYADPDENENFYTSAWTYDVKTDGALLAAAGFRGVVRIISIEKNECVAFYIGHGQAINELKFHPYKPYLLCSGSKDHSLRLWNIQTNVCIAILGGVDGHRDEVLSLDFDLRGESIMSSGMDHSLKLWRINTPAFSELIESSNKYVSNKSQLPFPTKVQHFPDFSTRDVHRNYVDCVQWYGDALISKSCENTVSIWKPGTENQQLHDLRPTDSKCTILMDLKLETCELWFVRFGYNMWTRTLALGNQHGRIFVWQLDRNDPRGTISCTLNNTRCNSNVRQVSFSRDGSVLVYVCDDATIWRWNRKNL